MPNYLATFGLMFVFVADYIGFVVWLMRVPDTAPQTVRFGLRGLFFATTVVAIHVALVVAFMAELAPPEL